ncbi:2OG-Fe(II) oxygenase [[Phormidium] sp. ETS-05]|uniref:2OG-Fe(II) oxygenase n=1 Tax=[Phormidium] sp. ETS-05 TaxID=222819 RepID=UPI0018EEF709|nr:2OG-Fe(II) oxygenase [[Phormidium] sp. ETS-05]
MTNEANLKESDGVNVMLLLKGGNNFELSFPTADTPLLRELFQVLLTRSTPGVPNRLFKIPIQDGKASMYFPSDSLIAIATDPPMLVDNNGLIAYRYQQAELPSNYLAGAHYLQIDDFLSQEECQKLLDFVIAKESEFVASGTYGGPEDGRQSKVLYNPGDWGSLMRDRLNYILPDVLEQLVLSPFEPTQIDLQITAHNNSHYYKPHSDNNSPETAKRQLSYVYYFHRQPKAFTGGELRMYDPHIEDGEWRHSHTFKTIEPRHNSIVFFCSGHIHEVCPVTCPSQNFADSRFTMNGWIYR